MASIRADLASSFAGFAFRTPNPNSNCFTRIRTTLYPLFRTSKRIHTQVLSYSSLNIAKPRKCARTFTVAATSTTTPQNESSDVTTLIPHDNRIPATIITGFLGSGKVF